MKVKKTTIIGLFAVLAIFTSAMMVIQAKSGNEFDNYLRANGWTLDEYKRRINRGDFSEEEGVNLEQVMYVSYLHTFNLTELKEKSELVIHGVIESSVVDANFDPNGIELPDVYTKFTIKIKDVLKGSHTEDTIIVTQRGGTYNEATFRVKDDPLMTKGDEVVLYLAYSPLTESYMIIGGPQGRYQIQDGKLYHISELDKSIGFVTTKLHVYGADAKQLRNALSISP
jgi:hypothetical protein